MSERLQVLRALSDREQAAQGGSCLRFRNTPARQAIARPAVAGTVPRRRGGAALPTHKVPRCRERACSRAYAGAAWGPGLPVGRLAAHATLPTIVRRSAGHSALKMRGAIRARGTSSMESETAHSQTLEVARQGSDHAGAEAAVSAMRFAQVFELPRIIANAGHDDVSHAQRLAALAGAYLRGDAVAVGWHRSSPGGKVGITVGGDALIKRFERSGRDEPEVTVNLPPGSRGIEVDRQELNRTFDRLKAWTRVTGVVDALSMETPTAEPSAASPSLSLDETVTTVWREPFAWLAVAVPVGQSDVRREASTLARSIPALRSKASNSQEHAVNLERDESRYRELLRAELQGLWDVHVLVGAADAGAAAQFAALLCASIDLSALPYTLRPSNLAAPYLDALSGSCNEDHGGASPFRASTDLLAAIAAPPRRELAGIRLRQRPTFDITPETAGDIRLGPIVDSAFASAGLMTLSDEALKRHTFVCGATGAGKSQTVRNMLESLASRPGGAVPWLVIEPAKAEYRNLAGRLQDGTGLVTLQPGAPDVAPAGINPLEPEAGFPLQTHVDLTRALFLAAFQANEPFPQVISLALTRCYAELGWDLALGETREDVESPTYPSLGDLQRVARDVVTEIGYGAEIMRNVRGFVDVRLSSLRYGTPGHFFESGHPLDIGELLRQNVVLEIQDLGDDQDKAFLMGAMIIRLYEHLRVRDRLRAVGEEPLRHVTVIEEAHRLLRSSSEDGSSTHAVELFGSLLAEVRAYGEGIIVAEQIPSKIIPDVIKNTSIKIMHRLPARDDREAVGATMNLSDEQSEFMVTVQPGLAAVFTDGMDYPALVRVDLGEDRESAERASTTAPLAGRFSAACGAQCQQNACTLRQMRLAQHVLDDEPSVALWTEVVVLAHIVGLPSPSPGAVLLESLARLDERTQECALAHAVQRAVAVRTQGFSRLYSAGSLAAHLADVLHAQITGQPQPCSDVDHWEWQAGPYRWNHIRQALELWKRVGETAAHPETERWATDYGIALKADSPTDQVAELKNLTHKHKGLRPLLLFGSDDPSEIETSVGSHRNADDWQEALTSGLDALLFDRDWRWPEAPGYLRGTQPAAQAQ
jgi:uncharacterized protein